MAISLFKELKAAGFHSSISTTYSVDPAFYDSTIQYKLRVNGCRNNILLADQGMLTRALLSTPEAFQKAGLEYVVKGFSHSRSFHPKILARYGKNRARLIIGSANATCAGWGRNLEALSIISWKRNSDSKNNLVYQNIVHKTHNYLMKLIGEDGNENVAYKVRLIRKESRWLKEYEFSSDLTELEDGSHIDVLFGFPGQPSSLFSQFLSKIEDEPKGFSIISPYWDSNLRTLSNLWSKFGEIPTKVWLNIKDTEMNQSSFPTQSLKPDSHIEFFQTSDSVAGRFLHAKIICIHTAQHDHILFGSANCTFAALGSLTSPGLNDEACVYRRVKRNTLAEHLDLNEDNPVEVSSLKSPEESEEEASATIRFDPGSLILFGRKIIWKPDVVIPILGSKIIVEGIPIEVKPSSESQGYVLIDPELINSTIVAVVELPDGQKSRPVIIEAPDVLKSAAPSSIQKGLQDKLNAVISGESDLINLARDLHLIFASDPDHAPSPSPLQTRSKSRSASVNKMGIDYDSPEAFRAALSVSDKINRQDLAHADNPALQAILKIVLRGLIDFTDSEDVEALRQEEAAALESGEFDDGSGHKDTDDYADSDIKTQDSKIEDIQWSDSISLVHFEKNQYYLFKVIDDLEDQIQKLSKNPSKINSEFITQILFVFYLMMYGCTHEYRLDDGNKRTLIAFGLNTTKDRSRIFLTRAAVLVKNLWGDQWGKNLIRYIEVENNLENLPIPVYTLTVLSRWILAAICVEVTNNKEYTQLKTILDKQIPHIFKNTFCFSIDPEQMAEIITEIQNRVVSDKLFAERVLTELTNMTKAIETPAYSEV